MRIFTVHWTVNFVLGIFIDFSKAFDSVQSSILIKKLVFYGVNGNLLNLLTSYLQNWKQYVSYGGKESDVLDLTCGVPQGSVFGPLLFIHYVNDLINVSSIAKFVLFANDCNIFIRHKDRATAYRLTNKVEKDIQEYCKANLLIFNIDKCLITSKNFI